MTKSMQNGEKLGFSLAEALITLLIVCLITLASIPVLTKKRRDLSRGDHGKYYCTLNSSNDYVEYYSQTANGDINNPDTWSRVTTTTYQDEVTYTGEDGQPKTKTRNRCVFRAPSGARNFNVTVIGGGGGGHDGSVEYNELFRKSGESSGSFLANSDYSDYYDLILVAGGGGGGGSPNDTSDQHAGVGGGGASGAYVKIAHLYLLKNASYKYKVGKGGGSNAGVKRGCCKPNKTDHDRAGNGGDSYFKSDVNGNINIYVPGGVGGDSIGCTNKKCRGGGAGWGLGNITVSGINSDATQALTGGTSGNNGTNYCTKGANPYRCGTLSTVLGGKNIIDTFELDADNNYIKIYDGSGGDGKGYGNQAVYGDSGLGGLLLISQSEKMHGDGGKAGKITSRFIPSLEGHIVADIPVVADSNKDGGTVKAELYKNKTDNGVLARSEGGSAGGKNKTAPTDGDVSPWTYKGNGVKAGACSAVEYMAGHYEYPKVKKFVCKSVKCSLSAFDGEYLKTKNNNVFPAGVKGWNDEDENNISDELFDTLPLSASISQIKTYINYLKISYLSDSELTGKINVPTGGGLLAQYDNKSDYDTIGCFFDEDKLEYEKVCADTKDNYETATVKKWVDAGQQQTCPAATNGKVFGAGGGGGRAGDLQGVFGKGGKGAPGAIIIEW